MTAGKISAYRSVMAATRLITFCSIRHTIASKVVAIITEPSTLSKIHLLIQIAGTQ
jgi:hypothetical protein